MAHRRQRARKKSGPAQGGPLVAPPAAPATTALVKGAERAVEPAGVTPVSLPGPAENPNRRRARRMALGVLLLAGIVYGARYGHDWLVRGQFIVSTDDAYVRSDLTIIAPKVAGYAAAVLVAENAHVKAGELLVEIEPGDYALAVAAATGKIATQDATIARIAQQIAAQQATVTRTRAQHDAALADLKRTASDLERTRELVKRAVSSRKLLDSAIADHARAEARVASAAAAIVAAKANVEVLAAQREEARSVRAEYETALAKTKRDLAQTQIRAPFDGVVGNLSVKPGQLVEPGTRLLALVPLDKVYVEANFKETRISGLKVGQPVDIAVDAFRADTVKGRIESIAPAAGQEFSLLPPQNATGNFTKIVQRVPVRISIPAEVANTGKLRPGLSVVVSVDTLDPQVPRPTLMGLLGLSAPTASGRTQQK